MAAEAARERLRRLKAGSRAEEIRQARSELASTQADLKLAKAVVWASQSPLTKQRNYCQTSKSTGEFLVHGSESLGKE